MAEVIQVAVYRQTDAVIRDSEPLNSLSKEIDYVLLTSSNIARAFAAALNEKAREMIHTGRTKIVSISPVTSAAVRELGWNVAAEALEFTTQGVVQSLLKLAREG